MSAPRPPRHSGIFPRNATALVIEPDGAVRQMLKLCLERRANFTVLATGSARQAVSLAQTFRASVVIMEQTLPGLRSQSLLRTMRYANGTKDAVLTLLADDPEDVPPMDALVVVPKPFSPLSLAQRLAVLTAVYAA